jgi:alkylation response protein AidB-like acyl-CoA dehydrogenase
MDFEPSQRCRELRRRIHDFVKEHVAPLEERLFREGGAMRHEPDWRKWSVPPEVEALKERARGEGLWNLFLPEVSGLKNVEYAPLAEEMGKSFLAPEIFNCNAPDTGNMEVIERYGSRAQKERWLEPLLAGKIRSAFFMTEPDVASSDATNMQATCVVEGDEVVLNGKKWWATGAGHPRCEVGIFMGVTDPNAGRHARHSMVLVPLAAKGVTIKRMLTVFGEYDPPYGHGEVWFDDVRLPASSIIAGPGRGFEIAQGRLGPGRIHHCMRCIGAAERALALMIQRGLSRVAFGKQLVNLGGNRERIADLRIAIDQARLLTLNAAWKIDAVGALAALTEISAIKVVAPNVLEQVASEAIQLFGGAGLSDDAPLAAIFAQARILRIADGPDAVHRGLIARVELGKYGAR